MSSPGRPFPVRNSESVLSEQRGVIDRVVDVHIGKLRQKIEDDPAQPLFILTVRVTVTALPMRLNDEAAIALEAAGWAYRSGFCDFYLLIWRAIDRRAADYLQELETRFHVSPVDLHRHFLDAVHHNLFWAS